ncbi:MAG: transglycosylase [Sphingomonadales bacterium 32-68-7]|nr:MAG: transglycosylase [Sphingomonadales bacterium 12-68-11]OYX10160.1 MAG: transglycosylase [Sphingomonadales bacterium 32-68-7]
MRGAIARAAEATGIDFNYLLAQAKLESSLDPHARAGTSSAAGLYQFIGGTWLDTLDKHGDQYGLGWASQAIDGGRVTDPALRGEIMALRYDPDAASLMAAELARDNRATLTGTLGREPDHAELYLAHFLGADGAARFLTSLQQTPDASAAALFPQAAAANRGVFYGAGGARSLTEVMDHFRTRMDQAGAEIAPAVRAGAFRAPSPLAQQPPVPLGPVAREFFAAAGDHAPHGRPSMVDTLARTFGGGAAPDNVRAAYAKLKAFDL